MDEEIKKDTPKWLQHLQENSWEAEILISGGAIFSLFQLVDWVTALVIQMKDVRGLEGTNEIFVFSHLAINGLIIGFISHLVLRSLWIALVCLRYAYPDGIAIQKLKIQPGYLPNARSADLTGQILKLDHLSGLIFFSSISFVLIIAGIILNAVFSFFILQASGEGPFNVFIVLFLLFEFDFLTQGVIMRRWSVISAVYKPVYLFFNFTALAFIFRPWLQVLFTNMKQWKLYIAGIIFVASSLGLTMLTVSGPLRLRSVLDARKFEAYTDTTTLWTENFYENKNKEGNRISFASIQNDLVEDQFLIVFVPYTIRHDELIIKAKAGDFKSIVSLKLDGKPVLTGWVNGNHFSSNQFGITTHIPIADIGSGKHLLTVDIRNADWPFPLRIPFWKQ